MNYKKRTILTSISIAIVLSTAIVAHAAPGNLDPTFGIGGRLTDWPGSARAKAVAIEPDGKWVVVAG